MHRSYGLQGSLKRRYKHPSLLPSMGTTRQKSSCRNRLQNGPRSLSRMKAGTHSALLKGSHTAAHTAKHGVFWVRVVSLPSARSARSRTSPGRVSERRTLPLWDLDREVLSKNAESLRDSDALMRVAVPRRRGPAGLRDLFRFCRNCGLYALFQILLSVLQTLQLVPFLCKLRLSSFLFGSEFNGFRSKQAGFFAIILENV